MTCALKKFNPLILLLFLFLIYSNVAHSKTLVFSTGTLGDYTEPVAIEIVKEVYKRLGIKTEFKRVLAEQSLTMSNSGSVDGEVVRFGGLLMKYPNLVKVKTPIMRVDIVAFVKDYKGSIPDVNSISTKSICIAKGHKVTELMTEGMKKVHVESTFLDVLKSVEKGVCEIALVTKKDGLSILKNQMKTSGVRHLGAKLASFRLYHYLHLKNKDLVSKVNAAIEEMKADRTLKRFQRQ